MHQQGMLSIGELAKRTGLAVSAIRFYEEKGLLASIRNSGGQRRFMRSDIRRLSFVLIAQKLGFTIEQIRQQLHSLPLERTPTKSDWTKMSKGFRRELNARIALLTQLRDKLDSCIGCGCLSLRKCALYNPGDQAGQKGQGPRYLMGDLPEI
ncbi:MAG: redox-sensitive transcriptional activator SoxR [Pseudomonadota bacterium]